MAFQVSHFHSFPTSLVPVTVGLGHPSQEHLIPTMPTFSLHQRWNSPQSTAREGTTTLRGRGDSHLPITVPVVTTKLERRKCHACFAGEKTWALRKQTVCVSIQANIWANEKPGSAPRGTWHRQSGHPCTHGRQYPDSMSVQRSL